MDKKIYKYLKDEQVIPLLANDILTAFKTKMDKNNVDYSFDITKGTGKIKSVEPNTFFNFDTESNSTLNDFKKALYGKDLDNLTQNEESLLVQDVSEFLKEVATYLINNFEIEIREQIRKNVLPNSQSQDIPLDKIFIISIDVADWSAIPEPQKYLLRIGKKPGTFINTDVVINYVQSRQEETGMTVTEIFDEGIQERNPLFENILTIEQGERYLYDITVTMFVDYSLSELPPQEICEKIKNT